MPIKIVNVVTFLYEFYSHFWKCLFSKYVSHNNNEVICNFHRNVHILNTKFCGSIFPLLNLIKEILNMITYCSQCGSSLVIVNNRHFWMGHFSLSLKVAIWCLACKLHLRNMYWFKSQEFCFATQRSTWRFGKNANDPHSITIQKLLEDSDHTWAGKGIFSSSTALHAHVLTVSCISKKFK